jgi:hypothetical protein
LQGTVILCCGRLIAIADFHVFFTLGASPQKFFLNTITNSTQNIMATNPLTPSSSMQDLATLLASLHIPEWKIHHKLIEYNDVADRERKISLLINKVKSSDPNVDDDLLDWYRQDMMAGDTIGNGITSMRQSGSIAMLCSDWEKNLAQDIPLGQNLLHVSLVFFKNNKASTLIFAFFHH